MTEHSLSIIPQAKQVTLTGGYCDPEADVFINKDKSLKKNEYKISITDDSIILSANSAVSAEYASATLLQILNQTGNHIPTLEIHDWPDFQTRGILYDVTRGRVPKTAELFKMVDQLALYKINQLQLYIEHAFKFTKHPSISRGSSPLTPDDIKALDAYCIERSIELVPAFASFGHMSNILTKPKYRHLAEDLGKGEYAVNTDKALPSWFKGRKGWSLAPANPDSYKFLDELYSELLPCFSSNKINVCCDEVFDMGLGQSSKMCKEKGKAGLFVYHVKKLRSLARKHGSKIMIWGDMPRKYPEILKSLPSDITILDWAYESDHNFSSIRKFTKAGFKTYACPGTSSWASLFPRLPEAQMNISGFAKAARKNNASALLTTDWGDGGHYNFLEFSWPGILTGAEQGWNASVDTNFFTPRFTSLFLNSDSAELSNAIDELGQISNLSIPPWYQSIWQHVLFASPDSDIFTKKTKGLTAASGRKTAEKLQKIRQILKKHSRYKNIDPSGILPYWIYAVDSMICSANKLALLGTRGVDSPEGRAKLKKDLKALAKRFEILWLKRNRRSGMNITLDRLQNAIEQL